MEGNNNLISYRVYKSELHKWPSFKYDREKRIIQNETMPLNNLILMRDASITVLRR